MRLMLQAQHAQPARQPDRPRRRLSQRLPAQERHQQRPLKHQKVLPLQSPQKARQLPVPVPRKRQKRMLQRHNNQQPLLHPPRLRKRQKLPPQPGMRRLQKRRQNHQKRTHPRAPVAQLPRQQRQEIPRRRQNVRDERRLLKRQRDRAPRLRQAQNSGCVVCQCSVNKCRAGLSQCHRRRKIGRKRRIVCFNSHNEGWRSH
ncbi:hypothetical protein BANRA_04759 [Escherichia coli]|nr:hypothetical protein BANRA_04759 [Escherichia coli]